MKKSLPLLALLVAGTLTSPLAAQDMSAFLNPGAMAARLGLSGGAYPSALRPGAAEALGGLDAVALLAALEPETRSLAPLVSLRPVPRRSLGRLGVVPVPAVLAAPVLIEAAPLHGGMSTLMAEARADAPAGANIAVISNGNGTVIHHGEAPRPSFWQRWFGN